MKRLLVLIVVAALAAFVIVVALRKSRGEASAVAELLPKDTALLVHLPDLNKTRDQWHGSDIYQIWREPAVQEFMRKPLTKVPPADTARNAWTDFMQLEPKDTFLALTAISANDPKVMLGFRFKGSSENAEKVVGKWRAELLAKSPDATRGSVTYQGHALETITSGRFSVSTVYDRDWFLASNDSAGLNTQLDRLDGRVKDTKATLKSDEVFAAAKAHMPTGYAALLYVQPKNFVDAIAPMLAATGKTPSAEQMERIRQIRSFCATSSFDGGKMRDVSFLAMPEANGKPRLTRTSLPLGTSDTFLYSAFLMNLATQFQTPDPSALGGGPLAAVQKAVRELTAQGVTLEQWKNAFGDEVGVVGDWAQNTRWPSLLASLPVKDSAKAKEIVDALTKVRADEQWTREESNGVTVYSMQNMGGFVPVTPCVAVSDKVLIAGSDAASVDAAMKRSGSTAAALGQSHDYQDAARALPEPTNAFAYVDTKTLFERVDIAIRPILLMSAAFVPSVSQSADFSKLPPPEVVTKHLSPMVMSQRYDADGYVTESIGPITVNQAALAVALGIAASSWWYHTQ